MQVFEKMVNNIVSETLEKIAYTSEFFSGTFFLNVDEENAKKVYRKLVELTGPGDIVMTKITTGEYAIDFL
jgi:hypothetical protein